MREVGDEPRPYDSSCPIHWAGMPDKSGNYIKQPNNKEEFMSIGANREGTLCGRLNLIMVIILAVIILAPSPIAQADEAPVTGSFTVVPFIIYDIQVSDITTSAATINWKTSSNATSQVFYDTQFHTDIADYAYHTDEDSTLVAHHSVRLTGLSSGTTYHFRVGSVKDDYEAISHDYTFTTRTPGEPGPGPKPTHYYLKVNFLGELSLWRISYSGRLYESVEITSRDGKINIHIPRGTLCLDKEEDRLREIDMGEKKAPEPPEDYFILGKAYDLTPDGATFDPYLRLTLAYGEEDIPAVVEEEDLYIAYYSSEWVPLDSIVDTVENRVSAELTHFTFLAIMAKGPPPPPPAKFVASKLDIIPAEVEPGEEVTISCKVTNTGGREGSHPVKLLINNVVEQSTQVTLAPGAIKNIVFTVSRDEPDSYDVAIDGLTGSFIVAAPAPPPAPAPPARPINWWLIAGIIAAIVAGLLIYRFAIKPK